jgi:hypothetical protein
MLKKLRVMLIGTVLAGTVLGADSSHDVTYVGLDNRPGSLAPSFDRGYLFQMDMSAGAPPTLLSVFAPDGNLKCRVSVRAPDGSIGYINQAAADADNSVAVTMWYGGYGGSAPVKGGGIVFFDNKGAQTHFLDTGRFMPNGLTFGTDHSVWTIGTQFGEGDSEKTEDYGIVRHYSANGELLGSYLTRSSFVEGLPPGGTGAFSWIKIANDRVGIMTTPGSDSTHTTFVELNFEGKELGRWNVAAAANLRWAYTSDARLFATVHMPDGGQGLQIFDKASGSWHLIHKVSGMLMGADGVDLVYLIRTGPQNTHLQRVIGTREIETQR